MWSCLRDFHFAQSVSLHSHFFNFYLADLYPHINIISSLLIVVAFSIATYFIIGVLLIYGYLMIKCIYSHLEIYCVLHLSCSNRFRNQMKSDTWEGLNEANFFLPLAFWSKHSVHCLEITIHSMIRRGYRLTCTCFSIWGPSYSQIFSRFYSLGLVLLVVCFWSLWSRLLNMYIASIGEWVCRLRLVYTFYVLLLWPLIQVSLQIYAY